MTEDRLALERHDRLRLSQLAGERVGLVAAIHLERVERRVPLAALAVGGEILCTIKHRLKLF